jgi:hypothetical protein
MCLFVFAFFQRGSLNQAGLLAANQPQVLLPLCCTANKNVLKTVRAFPDLNELETLLYLFY